MCVQRKKQIGKKKHKNIPLHPKHTTRSTAARRPRRSRDGVRRNTSHELAHTRKHSSQVCRSRPRTAFALSKNDEGYTYTDRRTDRQTDRQTNLIMAPCTHPGTSRKVNEARGGITLAASRVRSKKRKRTKKHENPLNTKKTHHEINSQQPGDRNHLETSCDETRPTR